MVVGIIIRRDTVPLLRVTARVKIDEEYYVKYAFKSVFSVCLPRSYPKEMDKVYLHHYKASSHTANLTTCYLAKMKEELGFNIIAKSIYL